MSDQEILGNAVSEVNHLLGADVDPAMIFNAGGEIISTGMKAHAAQQAKNKAEADLRARGEKIVAADAAWASAEAAAEIASKSGDLARISTMQSAAQMAQQSASMAAMGAPPELAQKRVELAQVLAQRATEEAVASPGDQVKGAKMRAWQKVLQSAQMGAMGGGFGSQMQQYVSSVPSFLTKQYGGIPAWGWGVGSIVVVTGLVLLLRRK